MALGGIYDQLGGGFHRYAVDARLARAALREDALRQRPARPRLPRGVRGDRRAALRRGGRGDARLPAARDAAARRRLRLGPGRRHRRRGGLHLRVDARAGRERCSAPRTRAGGGALRHHRRRQLRGRDGALARIRASRRRDLDAGSARRDAARARLRARPQPARDDKALASWNGLALAALAEAGWRLGRPDLLDAARGCAGVPARAACRGATAACGAPYRDGERPHRRLPRRLCGGLRTACSSCTRPPASRDWLGPARQLARAAVARFADARDGGFFYSAARRRAAGRARTRSSTTTRRRRATRCSPMSLLRLGADRRRPRARERSAAGAAPCRSTWCAARRTPSASCSRRSTCYLSAPREVAVVGPRDDPATARPAATPRATASTPRRCYAFGDGTSAAGMPLLEGKGPVGGAPGGVHLRAVRLPGAAHRPRRVAARWPCEPTRRARRAAGARGRRPLCPRRHAARPGHRLDRRDDARGAGRAARATAAFATWPACPPRRPRPARCRELGIPLTHARAVAELDVVIDGADEIDPGLDLIKGLGGAHLREKVVAIAARRMVVVADETKARVPARRAGAAPGRGDPVRAARRRAAAARARLGAGAAHRWTAARSSPTRATASSTAAAPTGSDPAALARRCLGRPGRGRARVLPGFARRRSCATRRRRSRSGTAQPPLHDRDGLRALVDQDVARGPSSRPTAPSVPEPANKSRHAVAGRGRRLHHPAHDPLRLLGRVAGLLAAGRRDDRVPPDVGGQLPAGRLLGRHEPRRHVRLALDRVGVEQVAGPGRARRPGSCRASPASAGCGFAP